MHAHRRPDTAGRDGLPRHPTSVRSVAKAARILRCFDSWSTALTVRDIAHRTGLPRSTCHAICSTLVGENMLELRPGGGYLLGVELVVLGGQVIERTGLVDAAVPAMNALAASTGSEIHLGQLDDTWIVYLNRVGSVRRLRAHNRFGLRVPAHLTGCGKAALSRMDAGEARRIATAGGVDADGLDRLMSELESARTRRFAVSTSFQTGFASVAAAVTGPDGRIVGGLSIADRRETFGSRRVAVLGSAVRDAADSISRQLARRRPCTRVDDAIGCP